VLLSADYMMVPCTKVCWHWTKIIEVIWKCIKGPVIETQCTMQHLCCKTKQTTDWSSDRLNNITISQ